jgi:putative aldouronate transport system substrate-binding protein
MKEKQIILKQLKECVTMKKVICLILVAGMLMGFSGCVQKKNAQNGAAVTLKWVMPGPGEQQDSEMVWNEFNKKLKGYPGMENVTIDFDVIPQADYVQKFLLLQTSSDKMDIVQTYTLDFPTEVRNGTFIEIQALIDKEAPDLKTAMPHWMWGYGKVDNKTYMVPIYQQMNSVVWGLRTAKESADKYMDASKVQKVFSQSKYFDESCYDVVEEYLAKLKEADKLGLGFNGGAQATKGYEGIANNYSVSTYEGKPIVYNSFQTPASRLKYLKMGEWFQKGYIRKDVLSAKRSDDNGKVNGNAIWFDQTLKGEEARDSKKYSFGITNIPIQDYFFIPSGAAAGGNCIAKISKSPETAIKFLELMNSPKGKELYNLLVYGIEGTHYTKIAEDKIETKDYVGLPTASSKYGLWKWILGNVSMAYDTQVEFEGWKNYIFDEVNKGPNTIKSKLIGFTPNIRPIETKLAQIATVCNEYGGPLGAGALPDYKEKFEEFMVKLDKAGNQEVIAELQKQVDEFLAKQ